MQTLPDETTTEKIAEQFERGILESAVSSAEKQLGDSPTSLSLPTQFHWQTRARQNPAELMAAISLYDVQLPPAIRRVSAGCIEAMKYISETVTKTSPHTVLNTEKLGLVAACFSSPQRMQLIAERKTPEDPDLRELLSDWGLAFVLCVHAIGSRWPAITSSSRGEGILRERPDGTHEIEWTDELNERRCALIDRKVQGIMTEDEEDELETLQQALRRYVNRVVPLPFDAARQLHAELLKKQQAKE